MHRNVFTSADLENNFVLTQSEFLNRNKNLIQNEIEKQIKKIKFIMNNKAGYNFEEEFSNKFWIRKSRSINSEIYVKWGRKKIEAKMNHKNLSEDFKKYINSFFINNKIFLITKPDFVIYIWDWESRKKIIIETKNSKNSIKKKQNNILVLEKLLNPGWYEAIVYIIKNYNWVFIDKNWVIRIWYNYLIENNIDSVEKLVEEIQKQNKTYNWETKIHYYKK